MVASGFGRQLSLASVCALLLSLLSPSTAMGQNSITLDPTQGAPGTEVRVSGAGFSPEAALVIWFAEGGEVARATADATGAFAAAFNVPSDATMGEHQVSVETSGMSGAAVATFEVTDQGPVTPDAPQQQGTLDPTAGPPGTTVRATGNAWPAGDRINVWWAGTSLAQTTAAATGDIDVSFTIPQEVTPREYRVTLKDGEPGKARVDVHLPFTVTETAGSGGGEPAKGAIIVDSTKAGWQETPLSLQQGQKGRISYGAGTWTVDYRSFPYVGPDGYDSATDSKIYQGCKLDASLPYGRLLGKLGDGALFSLGKGGEFTANASGTLSLKIHDHDNCLGDNDGSVGVDVEQVGQTSPKAPVDQATPIWAGYAVSGSGDFTGKEYLRVSGQWEVPKVNCIVFSGFKPEILPTPAVAFWVGLGGVHSNPLEQIGVLVECDALLQPHYKGVWEMLPGQSKAQTLEGFPVAAGDTVWAEVAYEGTGRYRLTLNNLTQSHPATLTATGPGDAEKTARDSAEWITEAPPIASLNIDKPLPDFGVVRYSKCLVDGEKAISSGPLTAKLRMQKSGSTETIRAQPSALASDGAAFSVKWLEP